VFLVESFFISVYDISVKKIIYIKIFSFYYTYMLLYLCNRMYNI